MVDIFDAGPVLSCPRDEIRSVRNSRRDVIHKIVDREIASPRFLIGTTTDHFRAAAAPLEHRPGDGVTITASVAKALGLQTGDAIRFVELDAA